MSGLSPRAVRRIIKEQFPGINRETCLAMEMIFNNLVNRLPIVHLAPPLDYLAFVDPDLTTKCMICLIREDLRAGGNAPIYIYIAPIDGQVGGDGGWIEIGFKEWSK